MRGTHVGRKGTLILKVARQHRQSNKASDRVRVAFLSGPQHFLFTSTAKLAILAWHPSVLKLPA